MRRHEPIIATPQNEDDILSVTARHSRGPPFRDPGVKKKTKEVKKLG